MDEKYNDFQEFMINTISDIYDVFEFNVEKNEKFIDDIDDDNFKQINCQEIMSRIENYYGDSEYIDDETWRCNLVHVMLCCILEMFREEQSNRGHCD